MRECVLLGTAAYLLTSIIPVLGVYLGHELLQPANNPLAELGDVLSAFANWDGQWYRKVVDEGYAYHETKLSSAAFFPAYPFLAKALVLCTGVRTDIALVLVSHACLWAAFILLASYCRMREGTGGVNEQAAGDTPSRSFSAINTALVLLAFGLLPSGFFLRMAYSESLFVLLSLVAFLGLSRNWPLPAVAAGIGLATATRPVAVALVLPLLLTAWRRGERGNRLIRQVLICLPLAGWGIAAFMAYLWYRFGDPLGFATAHSTWRLRPHVGATQKFWDLFLLEPIWSVYATDSACFWGRREPHADWPFSLAFANPLFLLGAVALIVVGASRRWLTAEEWSFSVAALFIPYVMRGHEMCLASTGRFVAAVFPLAIVLGQLLERMPILLSSAALALSACLLGVYAAKFAAWYLCI